MLSESASGSVTVQLEAITVDAICFDFNMKGGTGLDLLEKFVKKV